MRAAPIPTLVQRARELQALGLPGARLEYRGGKELRCRFEISPGRLGRVYTCVLKVSPDGRAPELVVVDPDLSALAQGRVIPHTYPHKGRGTKLCLWWPRGREWIAQMSLADTYIPWAVQWLHYFEVWLATGEWAGGGEHPRAKRWGRLPAALETS